MVYFHKLVSDFDLLQNYAPFSDKGDLRVVKWLPHCKCFPLLGSNHEKKRVSVSLEAETKHSDLGLRLLLILMDATLYLDQLVHEVYVHSVWYLGLERTQAYALTKAEA